MNCWEILGIDPTRDRAAIDRAYEQQKKFAAGDELDRLRQAHQEASGEQPAPAGTEQLAAPQPQDASESRAATQPQAPSDAELTAEEQQVVREVVIQVKALLSDSRRAADAGIWRAILAEPPADQPHLRAAIGQALKAQVRPMAENGSFSILVVTFLGDWFGWHELQDAGGKAPAVQTPGQENETPERAVEEDSQPPVANFWPAVVGWIVALAVLAAFFDGIFGGG
jgi:hypothetical protein